MSCWSYGWVKVVKYWNLFIYCVNSDHRLTCQFFFRFWFIGNEQFSTFQLNYNIFVLSIIYFLKAAHKRMNPINECFACKRDGIYERKEREHTVRDVRNRARARWKMWLKVATTFITRNYMHNVCYFAYSPWLQREIRRRIQCENIQVFHIRFCISLRCRDMHESQYPVYSIDAMNIEVVFIR